MSRINIHRARGAGSKQQRQKPISGEYALIERLGLERFKMLS